MRGISTNAIRFLAVSAILAGVSVAPASAQAGLPAYTIWTVGGSGVQCSTPPWCGDGRAAAGARLSLPEAVTVGRSGDVYIADAGDNEVRRVTPAGVISAIAGTGTICQNPPGCGDGGAATAARLSFPAGIVVDGAGNVYVADTGDNEIRKISRGGTITRVAGTGAACARPTKCGDGGPALSAMLNGPTGLALDGAGNLYIADTGDHEIRRVSKSGQITSVAGAGKPCAHAPSCGDGGPATSARLRFPEDVAVQRSGVLYIADSGDQEIRKVTASGTITTVAGTGVACSAPPACGDGGAATSARLNFPNAVAVGPAGTLFIADSSDNELRAVSGTTIGRVAGTGSPCAKPPACGDNQTASSAFLSYPAAVTVDPYGDIYVADAGDNEVRWLSSVPAGHIATSTGSVALTAFLADVGKSSVTVRITIGRPAKLQLVVSHSGHSETVGTVQAHAGFDELSWNRRFRGKPASPGRYKLTVAGALENHTGSSSLHVRL